VVKETLKGALVLVILERLYLTRSAAWMEDALDYWSLQTLLFRHTGLSVYSQTKLLFEFHSRIAD
jgi:hypothetical protein